MSGERQLWGFIPAALGIGVPTMMQVGPDDAVLNLCKWPRKALPALPENCLPGISADQIYVAAIISIAISVIWLTRPYLKAGTGKQKMAVGITLMLCGLLTGIWGLSIIASGGSVPSVDQSDVLSSPWGDPFGDLGKLPVHALQTLTINFAAQLRTFELNATTEDRKAQLFAAGKTPEERLADQLKQHQDMMELRSRRQTEFKNTYLHPMLQLKDEITSRLRKIGILEPPEKTIGGYKIKTVAFEGSLVGPTPIADAADVLEMWARRIQ